MRASNLNPVRSRRHFRGALAAALLGLAVTAAPALVPSALGGQSGYLRLTGAESGRTQHISLGLNKSIIIDLPADVKEVIVSQPSLANTIMRSKRRAILQGLEVGETNIFFLNGLGNPIAVFEVSVTQDSSSLSATLRRILPGSNIRVEAFGERVILSGTAQSQDDVNKAIAIAAQFTGSADAVANIISISGGQQVMLKVTVAEVSRETVKQLGINLNASLNIGGITTGLISTQPLGGASNVVTGNGVQVGGTIGAVTLEAALRALERRGAVRTLAEPTLTAMSGQEAEFLAGGEFPVPSGVEDGTVSFAFKRFGVNLKFTPVVKSNGIIGLTVDTSVSEPTTEGGFSAGGVTIPATRERQAKTSVELGSGQTLAIAGLIQDSVRQQINQLPGVGNIPILGALFRSRDFVHSQTELVILVTPYLAFPSDHAPVLPTDTLTFAGDAEAIFLGHIEKMYGVGEPNAMRGGYDGSVGFVLD